MIRLLICLLLTACTCTPEIREVKIPVVIAPPKIDAKVLEYPVDPVESLNEKSDDKTIAVAYRQSRVMWRELAKKFKLLIESR